MAAVAVPIVALDVRHVEAPSIHVETDGGLAWTAVIRLLDDAGTVRGTRRVRGAAGVTDVAFPPFRPHSGEFRATARVTDEADATATVRSTWFEIRRAGAVQVVHSVPSAGRRVALTFDDGFDEPSTASIVRTLRRGKAPATLFINGYAYRRSGALVRLVRSALRAGAITLGNHTANHRNLPALDDATVAGEIAGDRSYLWRTFRRSGLPYLRPPYGAHDDRVDRIAGEEGFTTVVLWSVDPSDYRHPPVDTVVQRVLAQVSRGAIVLMHLNPTTAAALPRVIAGLRERHYRIVPLTALVDRLSRP